MRTRIGLLPQPKSMRPIIDTNYNYNYYIKIGLVPAKPSRRTTFWTTLLFRDEVGSVLSLDEVTKSPYPSQAVFSDSTPITLYYISPAKTACA